jgi:hypothetical protein
MDREIATESKADNARAELKMSQEGSTDLYEEARKEAQGQQAEKKPVDKDFVESLRKARDADLARDADFAEADKATAAANKANDADFAEADKATAAANKANDADFEEVDKATQELDARFEQRRQNAANPTKTLTPANDAAAAAYTWAADGNPLFNLTLDKNLNEHIDTIAKELGYAPKQGKELDLVEIATLAHTERASLVQMAKDMPDDYMGDAARKLAQIGERIEKKLNPPKK